MRLADLPRHLCSMPGDPDIDFHVERLQVESVTVNGATITAKLTGGVGRTGSGPLTDGIWFNTNFTIGNPGERDRHEQQLRRWRDTAIRLELYAAPGRLAILIAGNGEVLPLPPNPTCEESKR